MHTPGPWKWDGEYPIIIKNNDGKIICSDIYPSQMDDARLISAAPDLLEALKNVISFYPYTYIDPDTLEGCAYHQAKLAIEKAERGRGE